MPINAGNYRTQLDGLSHDSLGPTLLAVVWSSVACSSIILVLRVYCKRRHHRGLWWDDYFVLGSWVCLTLCVCFLTYGVVRLDYGARDYDFPPENFPILVKHSAIAHPAMLISIMWSKTSFGVSLLRITNDWTKRALWFLIITINVVLGFSILLFYISCTPIQASWDVTVEHTSCWDNNAVVGYHIFSGVWSAVADLALVFFPWKILWGVQMLPKEKLGVAVAMSMGVFAACASIIKTSKLKLLASGSLYAGVPVMYWGPLETATSIIAASIPILRVLVRDVYSSARSRGRAGEGTDTVIQATGRRQVILAYGQMIDDDSKENIFGDAGGILELAEIPMSRTQEDHGRIET